MSTTARARGPDPETSHEAAGSIRPTKLEAVVLNELKRFPFGATTPELAERLDLSLVTVSPRIRPLVEKGLARDSGLRAKGKSGRSQIIWVATV